MEVGKILIQNKKQLSLTVSREAFVFDQACNTLESAWVWDPWSLPSCLGPF